MLVWYNTFFTLKMLTIRRGNQSLYIKTFLNFHYRFHLLFLSPLSFSLSLMFSPPPPAFVSSSLSLWIRNGIYPMTAFGVPSPHQPQQETVKSPVVVPLVKSPTPEPIELETRRVRTGDYIAYYKSLKKTLAMATLLNGQS